jgi:hypothetical protein
MNWASVSSTVLPLVGVLLGFAGTLLGQHLSQRGESRREAARQAGEQRAERKDAIIGFLSAAERIEHHRGLPEAQRPGHDGQLTELLHAVWLAKKIIELVCSGDVAQAAHDYTRELNRRSHELERSELADVSAGLTTGERRLRAEFIEAARREMGYQGEPLQHRGYQETETPQASA